MEIFWNRRKYRKENIKICLKIYKLRTYVIIHNTIQIMEFSRASFFVVVINVV